MTRVQPGQPSVVLRTGARGQKVRSALQSQALIQNWTVLEERAGGSKVQIDLVPTKSFARWYCPLGETGRARKKTLVSKLWNKNHKLVLAEGEQTLSPGENQLDQVVERSIRVPSIRKGVPNTQGLLLVRLGRMEVGGGALPPKSWTLGAAAQDYSTEQRKALGCKILASSKKGRTKLERTRKGWEIWLRSILVEKGRLQSLGVAGVPRMDEPKGRSG